MSVQVMVNGIPGSMGRIVAETCVARGLELVPYSLTGEINTSPRTKSLSKKSRKQRMLLLF